LSDRCENDDRPNRGSMLAGAGVLHSGHCASFETIKPKAKKLQLAAWPCTSVAEWWLLTAGNLHENRRWQGILKVVGDVVRRGHFPESEMLEIPEPAAA